MPIMLAASTFFLTLKPALEGHNIDTRSKRCYFPVIGDGGRWFYRKLTAVRVYH